MSNNRRIEEAPLYLRDRFPSLESLVTCLSSNPSAVDGDACLFRAAYLPESVLPQSVKRAYRFGPPDDLIAADGSMPYWWLYAAHEAETAIWESQFCKNDITRPGTFYFDEFATQHGVIAELRFPRPLRLWNINGSVASRLGIYDDLSSPDWEWSQWFGYLIDRGVLSVDATTRPDGFVYPSRRHRGHTAVAISSHALPELRDGVVRIEIPFSEHPEYMKMCDDQLRVPPPLRIAPAGGK